MDRWVRRSAIALPALSLTLWGLGHGPYALARAATSGPAAIEVGPVDITPTLGMDVKYQDNIYRQENDETDSFIYSLRPEINARAQDRENLYQLTYRGATAWYDEDSSNDRNNYFDHWVTANANILPAERWKADASASYAWLHEDRGTGLTEGLIGEFVDEPVEYEQADIGGSVEYGSGIGRLRLNAGYMERQYQNFKEQTRTRDRDETSLGTTFFYPVAPKTDIFLDYQFKDISYPNPFEDRPPLDSDEHSLQGGVEWEITPNLTSSAQAGYFDKSFDDAGRSDEDGIGWKVDLWMQPREQDTITVVGSRAPEETSQQGDFIRRETLTTTWKHTWSDRFNTSLAGTWTRETYKGSVNDREDDVYNVTVRANYNFRRWAIFYTSYAWDDKDSNADNLSYTAQTVVVGVDLSL